MLFPLFITVNRVAFYRSPFSTMARDDLERAEVYPVRYLRVSENKDERRWFYTYSNKRPEFYLRQVKLQKHGRVPECNIVVAGLRANP